MTREPREFTPAHITRNRKASEVLAQQIVQDIRQRDLPVGHRLPSESEMTSHFGVGRITLREALRLLEVNGLISIRTGPSGGPSVDRVDPTYLGRIATLYFQMAGATYVELYDSCVVAEGLLAEWAARNPDAALRRRVMAPYLHGESMVAEDPEEYSRFHVEISSLVPNRVLVLMLQGLIFISIHHMTETQDIMALRGHRGEEIDDIHARIARAIAAGRARRARQLMEEHMREHMADPPDETIAWL